MAGQRLQAVLLAFTTCVALHKVLACSSHLQNVANSAFPREIIQAVREMAGTLRRPGTGQVLEPQPITLEALCLHLQINSLSHALELSLTGFGQWAYAWVQPTGGTCRRRKFGEGGLRIHCQAPFRQGLRWTVTISLYLWPQLLSESPLPLFHLPPSFSNCCAPSPKATLLAGYHTPRPHFYKCLNSVR